MWQATMQGSEGLPCSSAAISVILTSAQSDDSIQTGILRRLPLGSMTVTAPSPRLGSADDLQSSAMKRVKRIENLNVRSFRTQGIVGADGIIRMCIVSRPEAA